MRGLGDSPLPPSLFLLKGDFFYLFWFYHWGWLWLIFGTHLWKL